MQRTTCSSHETETHASCDLRRSVYVVPEGLPENSPSVSTLGPTCPLTDVFSPTETAEWAPNRIPLCSRQFAVEGLPFPQDSRLLPGQRPASYALPWQCVAAPPPAGQRASTCACRSRKSVKRFSSLFSRFSPVQILQNQRAKPQAVAPPQSRHPFAPVCSSRSH